MAQKAPEKKMPSTAEHNEALTADVGGSIAPMNSPVGLVADTGECIYGLKERCLFGHDWDQRRNQQRVVGLRVDMFNGHLEAGAITAGFR
jgi:hypothetical protein